MVMKHLCFDYTLSLLLLVLMFCTLLCDYFFCIPSLLLSLQMQISSGFLLIFFQLIKCLWGRREPKVWSVSFKHTLHAASNFILWFTVISITNGSEKKSWFYFEKMEKGFLSNSQKIEKKKRDLLSTLWNWKNPQVTLTFMLLNLLNSFCKPQPLCGIL